MFKDLTMKSIIITEHQENILKNLIKEEVIQELGTKRLTLMSFLDNNFMRGDAQPTRGEFGRPTSEQIVVMVKDGKPLTSMTDKQLFKYVQMQPEFRNILSPSERDKFLKDSIIAWYNHKINKKTGNIVP
jgi:hypothetical protein